MQLCCYIEFFTGAKFGSRDWLAIYHTTVVIRYFMPYRRIHIMRGKSLLKSAHKTFPPPWLSWGICFSLYLFLSWVLRYYSFACLLCQPNLPGTFLGNTETGERIRIPSTYNLVVFCSIHDSFPKMVLCTNCLFSHLPSKSADLVFRSNSDAQIKSWWPGLHSFVRSFVHSFIHSFVHSPSFLSSAQEAPPGNSSPFQLMVQHEGQRKDSEWKIS